jgi:hypothetical protein
MKRTLSIFFTIIAPILTVLFLVTGLALANPSAHPLLQGGAPTVISYQGQVMVDGVPYTGTGYFKFAILNGAGSTTFWSNDGTSTGGGEPTNAVSLNVANGLFNVLLGDTSLGSGMTQTLDASVFDGTDRSLRVWFSDDNVTFTQLSPDRSIAAVPYALQAEETKNAWRLTGNAGTTPGAHFLGTTDAVSLTLVVSGTTVMRLEPTGDTPNIIGGYSGNSVAPGVVGATIGGGGASNNINRVTADYAVIAGGDRNTATGDYSAIGGGGGHMVNGRAATIGGGGFNKVYPAYATIGGGRSNLITGTAGSANIGGGRDNVITGTANFATVPGGFQAEASHYGEMAYASGNFAETGDAQTSMYVLRKTSSGTTQTELFLNPAGNERITLPVGRTMTFDILVVAAADNGQAASYHYVGGIKRTGGGTALLGTVQELMALEDDTNWSVLIDADTGNDALRIRVTGATDRTIRWVATVRTVETVMP